MAYDDDDVHVGGPSNVAIAVYAVAWAVLLIVLAWVVLGAPGVASARAVDPNPTTGVSNPAVTDANIATTICADGWTKTIRPPASYTNKLKAAQLPPGANLRLWEEDHVRPLEAGGDPRDPHNLRPQLWIGPDGAHAKDGVETATKRAICSGSMTLEQGQAALAAWITEHHPYPLVQPGAPQ